MGTVRPELMIFHVMSEKKREERKLRKAAIAFLVNLILHLSHMLILFMFMLIIILSRMVCSGLQGYLGRVCSFSFLYFSILCLPVKPLPSRSRLQFGARIPITCPSATAPRESATKLVDSLVFVSFRCPPGRLRSLVIGESAMDIESKFIPRPLREPYSEENSMTNVKIWG